MDKKDIEKLLPEIKKLLQKSNDPDTQVAALIIDHEGVIVGSGCNYNLSKTYYKYLGTEYFQRKKDPKKFESPEKYLWTIHAEQAALLKSVGYGEIMICTHLPCHSCMKMIVQSQIEEVIYFTENFSSDHWEESKKVSKELAKIYNISLTYYPEFQEKLNSLE